MGNPNSPTQSPDAEIGRRTGGIAAFGIKIPVRARKPLVFLIAAMCAALAICYFWKPVPYSEQLIRVQAEQELGHIDNAILNEPLEVQGMLLDYSSEKGLVLKAWIALSRYPDKAREILMLYGAEPEFKEILLAYGESVVPVIQYFRDNEVWTVKAGNVIATTYAGIQTYMGNLRNSGTGNQPTASQPAPRAPPNWTEPDQRGWYAVNIIRRDGHDFLGQFDVMTNGVAIRNQTDRILKAITSFFTSGVRTIETKYDLDEHITAGDAMWAVLDVAAVAAPLRLLKAGKVVEGSTKELSIASRTRVFAPRLLSKAKVFQRFGKYGLIAATAYIIVTHPNLINSLFAEAAKWLGLDPWLVQFAGWSLIIALALYPVSWVLKPLARLILLCLSSADLQRGRRGGWLGKCCLDRHPSRHRRGPCRE